MNRDVEKNRKINNAAEKYTKQSLERTQKTAEGMSKAGIAAIAALAQLLSRLAMEGIKGIFNRNRNRQKNNNGIVDNLTNKLLKNKSKSITQRLGNKVRGLIRGGKTKSLGNIGRVGKTAKAARTATKLGKVNRFLKTTKAARTATKAVKAAKMARTANTAYRAAKVARTANTAYKAVKVAKLANVARIGLQGGVALAGGPVGIALLAGSIVAPIAIEAIWKNRKQIYAGGKKLVNKSKLSVQEISGLVNAKRAKVGEIVPRAQSLKVMGDNKQVLLETDPQGKVLTNNFSPNYKLAFYQQKEGENTMLLDEASLDQSQPPGEQSVNGEAGEIASQSQSGVSVIKSSLGSLKQNNPHDQETQKLTSSLGTALDEASQPDSNPGIRDSISLNEAGSSIINLFNSQVAPGQPGQKLKTAEFEIKRRGNDFFLLDQAGNTLMQARNTVFGSKVLAANLNPSQVEDLAYLKEDLRLGMGITGGFAPPEDSNQNQNLQGHTEHKEQATMSQSTSSSVSPPNSMFSQYLPEQEQIPALAGNSKEQSTDMER